MQKDFWKKLEKPFYALAPMAGVTDSAFRQVCKRRGANVLYSEMVSATALYYDSDESLALARFSEQERPFIVQLFGSDPSHFAKAIEVVEQEIKPDGIDINLGCPVPKVVKQGAGAALFQDLKRSREALISVQASTGLPISIKTRTKAGDIDILRFLDNIRDLPVSAIMIHGRTLGQGFRGPVDFATIKKARDYFGGIIMANGGVNDKDSAQEMIAKTGADGLGIGQGALGKPWIFSELSINNQDPGNLISRIIDTMLEHAELLLQHKGERGIIEMRKHLAWYVRGLPQARTLREKLVRVESLEDIRRIISAVF